MTGARSAVGSVPSLDIVIVNWNSGTQLRDCLESIAESDAGSIHLRRVVVVDNASHDGSADGLGGIHLPLVCIKNGENRGFAAACNQGAHGSKAGYLLFLNPDTVVRGQSLATPVVFMEAAENASIGICGIQLTDSSGKVARSCSRFPRLSMFLAKMCALDALLPPALARQAMSEWDHSTSRDVDQVIGAFFLVRRQLFESLGGFDERFFVYFEEVDLSFRAASAGHRSHYLASAKAFHAGGGTSHQVKALRLVYSIRSRLAFAAKHWSTPTFALLVAATLLIEPVSRIALALARRSLRDAAQTLSAYGILWRECPGMLRGALRKQR